MRSDQARNIPLDKYLAYQGHIPVRTNHNGSELWYRSPIREGDKTASFKVDTGINKWYDHGAGKGGNTLDLAVEFFNGSVREALAHLESTNLYAGMSYARPSDNQSPTPIQMVLSDRKSAIEKKKSLELTKQTELKHPALLQYLDSRRISRSIAVQYLKQIHFKHPDTDKNYFGLGFPSENGFEARNAFFKGFVGSGKTISKILSNESKNIYIFEGFMDFLTFLTMHGLGDFVESAIVMNSSSLKAPVLEEVLRGSYQNIHLYLDNDTTGTTLTQYFEEHLPSDKIVDHSKDYEGFKDLNKWFTSQAD